MNCSGWELQIAAESESSELEQHLAECEHCREFAQELEKNSAALREFTVPADAFRAVRQRVLGEIQVKKRRTTWWIWSAAAAAACAAIVCVPLIPSNPQRPAAIVAKKDPPRIEWTLPRRHKSSGRYLAQARPVRKTEPLAVVKMLTDDPNVIIIWLVDHKGDSL